jgi:hypothetical protein
LLAQESHLTKNTILSSFDLLLKANFFQDKDGYFYSAFFHLTIGLERLMKLAVVSDYMLKNNYTAPTEKYLRKNFGHEINVLYEKTSNLSKEYLLNPIVLPVEDSNDYELLGFLTKYGTRTRYFNLNELGNATQDKSPLQEWLELSRNIYHEYTSGSRIEKDGMSLFYKMDKQGIRNDFTRNLNFDGHPMTVYDIYHRQLVIEKSAPLVIWRVIELFQPVHFLLEKIAEKASEYEIENGHKNMIIPHYEDFFYFFNAILPTIKKRKRWLDSFNGS